MTLRLSHRGPPRGLALRVTVNVASPPSVMSAPAAMLISGTDVCAGKPLIPNWKAPLRLAWKGGRFDRVPPCVERLADARVVVTSSDVVVVVQGGPAEGVLFLV